MLDFYWPRHLANKVLLFLIRLCFKLHPSNFCFFHGIFLAFWALYYMFETLELAVESRTSYFCKPLLKHGVDALSWVRIYDLNSSSEVERDPSINNTGLNDSCVRDHVRLPLSYARSFDLLCNSRRAKCHVFSKFLVVKQEFTLQKQNKLNKAHHDDRTNERNSNEERYLEIWVLKSFII